jgi:hypothetical protein
MSWLDREKTHVRATIAWAHRYRIPEFVELAKVPSAGSGT